MTESTYVVPPDDNLLMAWSKYTTGANVHECNRIRSNYLWGCSKGDQAVIDRWERLMRVAIAHAGRPDLRELEKGYRRPS